MISRKWRGIVTVASRRVSDLVQQSEACNRAGNTGSQARPNEKEPEKSVWESKRNGQELCRLFFPRLLSGRNR